VIDRERDFEIPFCREWISPVQFGRRRSVEVIRIEMVGDMH